MNNYLEPLKVECALESEVRKLNYRAKTRPQDINILDYTVIDALEKQIPQYPIEHQELCDVEWLCPSCKTKVGDIVNADNYCRNCGQRIEF